MMRQDHIFRETVNGIGVFEFNIDVANVFDDMIIRSVPLYKEQQSMIKEIGKKSWIEDTNVYDLGCSTATTLINLCQDIEGPAYFIGYDNSFPMLEQAKHKIKESGLESRVELRYGDLNGPLSELSLVNASLVTLCWTMQFIRPLRRDKLINWIYQGLVEGGALVVTEKILTNDTHTNRFFIDLYYDFKRKNGYSDLEIMRKREALENVLIPYTIDENLELFRTNGFQIVETFFQCYNFAGFLCVKKTF